MSKETMTVFWLKNLDKFYNIIDIEGSSQGEPDCDAKEVKECQES